MLWGTIIGWRRVRYGVGKGQMNVLFIPPTPPPTDMDLGVFSLLLTSASWKREAGMADLSFCLHIWAFFLPFAPGSSVWVYNEATQTLSDQKSRPEGSRPWPVLPSGFASAALPVAAPPHLRLPFAPTKRHGGHPNTGLLYFSTTLTSE
jgi:hypothetical protein